MNRTEILNIGLQILSYCIISYMFLYHFNGSSVFENIEICCQKRRMPSMPLVIQIQVCVKDYVFIPKQTDQLRFNFL